MRSPFFKLTLLVGRDLKDPISRYVFEVKPPLLAVIGFAIAKEAVCPDRKAPPYPGMSYAPSHCSVEGCIRFVPGTDLDTGAAAGASLISYSHSRTFSYVDGPLLITVIHLLSTIADSAAGTCPGTLLTLGAEILETEFDGFIR